MVDWNPLQDEDAARQRRLAARQKALQNDGFVVDFPMGKLRYFLWPMVDFLCSMDIMNKGCIYGCVYEYDYSLWRLNKT